MIIFALILIVAASLVTGEESKGPLCFPTGYCRDRSSIVKRLIIAKIREFMVPTPPIAAGLQVTDAYSKTVETGKQFIAIFEFHGADRRYKMCITKFLVKTKGEYEVLLEPLCLNSFKELYAQLVILMVEEDVRGIAVIEAVIESLLSLLGKWKAN